MSIGGVSYSATRALASGDNPTLVAFVNKSAQQAAQVNAQAVTQALEQSKKINVQRGLSI